MPYAHYLLQSWKSWERLVTKGRWTHSLEGEDLRDELRSKSDCDLILQTVWDWKLGLWLRVAVLYQRVFPSLCNMLMASEVFTLYNPLQEQSGPSPRSSPWPLGFVKCWNVALLNSGVTLLSFITKWEKLFSHAPGPLSKGDKMKHEFHSASE